MVSKTELSLVNFVGGEVSQQVAARADLDVLQKSLSWAQNFTILPQGGAAYRSGTFSCGLTKGNTPATLIPFQFSANDALMIVATDLKFRFYRNDAVILNTALSVQGITKANPGVVNAAGHNYVNGDEVYIAGASGMTQVNNRFFVVANALINTKAIAAITKANPAVVTTGLAHGLTTGMRIYISSALGMTQVNGQSFLVTVTGANTFSLQTLAGVNINSTAYGVYAGAGIMDASKFELQDQWSTNINTTNYGTHTQDTGTVASIYELTSPYQAADLSAIRFTQTADIMYLACKNEVTNASYAPYKLVRSALTSWTLGLYPRISDPFPAAGLLVLGVVTVTRGTKTTVTVPSTAALNNGDILFAEKITGTTQLNGEFFIATQKTATTFVITTPDGSQVNSTAYGAFVGGPGTFTRRARDPGCVAFSADGRLVLASTLQNPEGFWGSRTPLGFLTRYDDFTAVGTDPTMGMAFSFTPVDNKVDSIREVKQFGGNFALIGASSVRLVYGAQQGQPATPIAINTLPAIQGGARVAPLVINWSLLFVDVNQKRLRGLQYNLAYSTYQANDFNLTSEHLGQESDFIKLAHVKGSPDIIYCLREDGVLLALTFNNIENIAGWSRFYAGNDGLILDIASIRKSTGVDQLWMVVQRTMGGKTFTTVEVMDSPPYFPSRRSFFTGGQGVDNAAAKAADDTAWQNATWEAMKDNTFLDCSLTYDGTARGTAAGAGLTITGSLTAGSTITITASASVFLSTDVNTQIWKCYSALGVGGGRAIITGYTSGTTVTALVTSDFNSAAVIPAGSWEFAVNSLTGLYIYEGLTVNLQADGGGVAAQTVSSGALTLPNDMFASRIQIGFAYTGRLATYNLEFGQSNGKPKNIKRVRARFLNTIGARVGTSDYNCPEIVYNRASGNPDRVPAPFTGIKDVTLLDKWSNDEKQVVVLHNDPTPCTILRFDVEAYASDPS